MKINQEERLHLWILKGCVEEFKPFDIDTIILEIRPDQTNWWMNFLEVGSRARLQKTPGSQYSERMYLFYDNPLPCFGYI